MLVFLIINVWCPILRLCTQRYNEINPFECIYFCAAAKASLIQCKSIVSNAYIRLMPNVIRIQYKTDNRFGLHFDKHTQIQKQEQQMHRLAQAHTSILTAVTLTYLIDWRMAKIRDLLSEFNINASFCVSVCQWRIESIACCMQKLFQDFCRLREDELKIQID